MPLLRVAFRYSLDRDAYVLRGVGERMGPVVRSEGAISRRDATNGITPAGAAGDAAANAMTAAQIAEQQKAADRTRRREQREALRQRQSAGGGGGRQR